MESNAQYAEREYWEGRFEHEEHYEWLAGFSSYKDSLIQHLRPQDRILHVGCGSSDLSMQLYALGMHNITNVDYSETLISSRRVQYPDMEWICDDMTTLHTLDSSSFDVVIEKATIEALLVKEKGVSIEYSPWSPSTLALNTLDKVWSSIARVLVPTGMFISISFTQPHFRVPALLRNPNWSIEVSTFGEQFHFFVYLCRKGRETNNEIVERYGRVAPDWLKRTEDEDN